MHAPVLYEDEEDLFQIMVEILKGRERPLPPSTLRSILEPLDWPAHVANYDQMLEEVVQARASVAPA